MKNRFKIVAAATLVLLLAPGEAAGYIGPGAGLTVIGTAVAFVAAVALGIVGFVWYPVKRIVRSLRGETDTVTADTEG